MLAVRTMRRGGNAETYFCGAACAAARRLPWLSPFVGAAWPGDNAVKRRVNHSVDGETVRAVKTSKTCGWGHCVTCRMRGPAVAVTLTFLEPDNWRATR